MFGDDRHLLKHFWEVNFGMNDHTAGVLEGLAYSRTLLKTENSKKTSATIARRILEITQAAASDLEFRLRATA